MKRFLLFMFILPTMIGFSQSLSEDSIKNLEKQVLALINAHRILNGLKVLEFNEKIYEEAKKHSQNMAKGKTPFSHEGFDGRNNRLMKSIGGSSVAENVAMGQETAKEALDSWLSSSGHRQNIEGQFDLSAVGIAQSEDGSLYFTQIFLLK